MEKSEEKIINQLTSEFNLRPEQVTNTVKLIDDGNTIPFIARYRKEATGSLSDEILRDFYDRLSYLRNLEDKKEEKSKKSGSIYDLLENNKNIIWKSTGTSDNINKSTIPVIGNNNLKPEILGSSKVDDLAFPDMNKKEGEILWKETM